MTTATDGRRRLATFLIGGFAIAATLVTALLTVTGGASAQPAPLTLTMTETHDSLQPGAQITLTVTVTNPDAAEQTTSVFIFADPELTFVPAAPDPTWELNPPAIQIATLIIPAGGARDVPLVLRMGPVAADKHVLAVLGEVIGDTTQLDIAVNDVGVTTVAEIDDPRKEPRAWPLTG